MEITIEVPIFDLKPEFDDITRKLEHNLGSMRVVLRSLEDDTYDDKLKVSKAITKVRYGLKKSLTNEEIAQNEIVKTYIQCVTDLFYFIDTIRAIISQGNDLEVKKIMYNPSLDYKSKVATLNKDFETRVIEKSHEFISMPDKFKEIGATDKLLEVLLSYNSMRNTLIHHRGIAKRDFTYTRYSIQVTPLGKEEENNKYNTKIVLKLDDIHYNKGDKINLEEVDIEYVLHVYRMFLKPNIEKLVTNREGFKRVSKEDFKKED